ncbi:hypothetical protein D3C77_403450 [compost metagenome]
MVTAPKLWQHDVQRKLAAVFQPPGIEQFNIEFLPILGDQRQGDEFGLLAELSEFAVQKEPHAVEYPLCLANA